MMLSSVGCCLHSLCSNRVPAIVLDFVHYRDYSCVCKKKCSLDMQFYLKQDKRMRKLKNAIFKLKIAFFVVCIMSAFHDVATHC